MSDDKTVNDNDPYFTQLEEWLSQSGLPQSGEKEPGQDPEGWESLLLDLVDARELSFSELNRKRKKLTFSAFRDPLISSKAIAVESTVAPNIHCMYRLFQRSHAIAELQRLPQSAEAERAQLTKKNLACLNYNFLVVFGPL